MLKNLTQKIKVLLIGIVSFIFHTQLSAQTTLTLGDIAFTGYNSDPTNNSDEFSFVILRVGGISSGTTITFTDMGWKGGACGVNNFCTTSDNASFPETNSFFTWTSGSSLPYGAQVKITGGGTSTTFICSNGTASGTVLSLVNSGDQIFALQGGLAGTMLAAIHANKSIIAGCSFSNTDWDNCSLASNVCGSSNQSNKPTCLTVGTNCIILLDGSSNEVDNGRLNTSVCLTGNRNTDLAIVNNIANWETNDLASLTLGTSISICAPTNTTWNGTSWSNGAPSSTIDAIIASNTAPASFTCKTLTINSGFALTTTGITATINGNITNNGNGISGTGNIVIASNAALAGNNINFIGQLTVSLGATLTTNDKLILVSDATNTGRVGNSAGSINGNVTVQRFIPSGRRVFRFLAHPFNSNLSMNSLTDNIDITGTGGSPFTTTQTNSPSAFSYNNATANSSSLTTDPGWQGLTAGSTFDTRAGYRILVRGTKGQANSLTGGTYTPAAVTLDWTGNLNSGNQVITLPNGGTGKSYSLVGNPYAAPVDLSLVTRGSSINANFSVWNAQAGSRGAYVTNAFSSSYILPSGSAFFAQSSANSNNTITFTEASKSNGTPSTLFRTSNSGDQLLKLVVTDWQNNFYDQLLFFFNNNNSSYTKEFDELWDGEKLINPDFNLYSLTSNAQLLAIDRRPITLNDSIKLGVYSSTSNSYLLSIQELPNLQNGYIYLKDKWLNTLTLLQPNQTIAINFTTDAASQGADRFELVFRTSAALPTSFVSVAAQQKGNAIEVNFATANEQNMHSYEVEESKDGSSFTKGTTLEAKNAATNNYSWLDVNIHNGNNYYRVKAIEKNGTIKYSQVVRVNVGKQSADIAVYPNPVKGGIINLQLTDIDKGVYTVRIYNNVGQEIANKQINHNGGSANQTISIGNVPTGKYNMLITNGTSTVTKTVIVE